LLQQAEALYQQAPANGYREDAILDLLKNSKPRGVDHIYLLADLDETVPPGSLAEQGRSLHPLLSLTKKLYKNGVHLKLFLPEDLRHALGDLSAYPIETRSLVWEPEHLRGMLQARIRKAGGDNLMQLCGPDVARQVSLDDRLIRAACTLPGRLVELGNRLLEEHVRRSPGQSLFTAEAVDSILGPPR
jgi:hypothetical protein